MMNRDDEVRCAFEHCSLAHSWIDAAAIRSMLEMNLECLDLLAGQAAEPASQSNLMLRQYRELWRHVAQPARERVAATPFLLLDLGFADERRWMALPARVEDSEPAVYAPFFTVPGAAVLARKVFVYAWDLTRTQEAAARLILAMPAHCTTLMTQLTVRRLDELAERHPDWLLPRWHRRGKVWRDILLAASASGNAALERARNHGYDLIEAEVRAAALIARGGGCGES